LESLHISQERWRKYENFIRSSQNAVIQYGNATSLSDDLPVLQTALFTVLYYCILTGFDEGLIL
jgi:hypothetical protein